MARNKIEYFGETLIDLTGDTVAAGNLLTGITAHNAAGVQIVGTMSGGGGLLPQLIVSGPTTGSTVIATLGGESVTLTENSGTWTGDLTSYGTWTVTATLGGNTASDTVSVTAVKQYSMTLVYFAATLNITAPSGSTVTITKDGSTVDTHTGTGSAVAVSVYETGTYAVTVTRSDMTGRASRNVTLSQSQAGQAEAMTIGFIYGYRKEKANSDPSTRITYLYDAVGKTPAYMNFSSGAFNYGDWADVWFVADNKPVMLKSDGTVDYELDHDDQTKKLDGTASDISNTGYDGNAMSAIPLCWFWRYEDTTYEYEIVSQDQWNNDFKAYAHTRADGSIEDYFYWSMFGGSGSASKIRSLANQSLAQYLNTSDQIAGATANGSLWYIHTWSKRQCIRTLLVLMGKSTNTQAVFGWGNIRSASNANALLTTGTLKSKGQFFGNNSNSQQVKVFYIESFWGDQWLRTAGLINNYGSIYYKMTPEGDGYQIDNVTGYTNSGITLSGTNGGYISATKCGEFGCIPTTISGGENIYECDGSYFGNGQFSYLVAGSSVNLATGFGGAFTFIVNNAPSITEWYGGCGLSADMSAAV